jgi:hypothetical protein
MKPLFFLLVFFIAVFTANAQNIRYVKPISTGTGDGSSWANASHDLQAMMNALKATGGQVWVAQGVYKPLHKAADVTTYGYPIVSHSPTGERHKSFVLVKDVEVYGGFQGIYSETALHHRNWNNYKTILSGDIGIEGDSTDNVFHVVISAGDIGTACLDGFTVTGGNAYHYFHDLNVVIGTLPVIANVGGGIYITDSSSLLIKNVIIENNIAVIGGGFYCHANYIYTKLQLINLIIRNNKADYSAAIDIEHSRVAIINTIIDSNVDIVGGNVLSISSCPSFIMDNTIISNNVGASILLYDGSAGTITNTMISNNSTSNLIYNRRDADLTITNTLINNNKISCSSIGTEQYRGVISNDEYLVITNSTIANNYISCDSSLSLIYNSGQSSYYPIYLCIRNCIIWNYNGETIRNNKNEYVHVVYENNIAGSNFGGVVRGVNPLFVDESVQNYQLQPCSPAIDMGNNVYYSQGSIPDISGIIDDLEGNPRFYNNGKVDMGAYEYQGPSVLFPNVIVGTDTTLCHGETVDIVFTFTGSPNWDIVYTVNNGITYDTIKNISVSPYILKSDIPEKTTYKLVSVSNNICERILFDSMTITVIPELLLTRDITSDILCSGENTKKIFLASNVSWKWEFSGDTIGIPCGEQIGIFNEYIVENNTESPLTALIKIFSYYSKGNIYCHGIDTFFSITVLPKPELQTMLSNDTLCSGEQIETIIFTGTATEFVWEATGNIVSIPAGIQTGNFGNHTVENKTNQIQEASITVSPQYQLGNKLCFGEEKRFNLLVYPQTQIHDVSKNKFIYCEEEMLEIQTEATGVNLSYQWYCNNNLLAGAINEFYIIPAVSRQDMGHYYGEVTGKCGVEKSANIEIAVSSDKMLIEKWDDVILVDNSTYEYYGYQWYRDNISIVGSTNQFYQELGGLQGCYSVELTLANGQKERSCERCIENKTNKSLSVYPNPVRQGENIQIQTANEIISVQLYSIEGRLIRIGNYITKTLSTNGLQPGIYIIRIQGKEKAMYKKQIIMY